MASSKAIIDILLFYLLIFNVLFPREIHSQFITFLFKDSSHVNPIIVHSTSVQLESANKENHYGENAPVNPLAHLIVIIQLWKACSSKCGVYGYFLIFFFT